MSRQTHRLEIQTRALQSDLKDLTRKHLEAENKVENLQNTVRSLKLEREKRERELCLTKKTCNRALHQKNKLQDEIHLTKDECRRLESRLHLLKDSASLNSKCQLYKTQVEELERQMQNKEDELFDMKRAYDRRSEEVETLTRALSIKAKELSASCGSDVHSRLLYAISQGEEECVKLASRLRQTENECRRLKSQSTDVEKWRLEEEQDKTERLKSELKISEKRCQENELQLSNWKLKYGALEQDYEERNKEISFLRDELESKEFKLEQHREQVQNSKKTVANAVIAKEQAEQNLNKIKQKMKDQSRSLRRKEDQLRSLKHLLDRREKLSREQLAHEREKRDDAILKFQKQKALNDQTPKQLPHLHEKAYELKRANRHLSHKMDSLVTEISIVREDLKQKDEMNENLRRENSKLVTENEALVAAKNLLQETMLDQIDSMRSRLRTQELQIKNSKDWETDHGHKKEYSREDNKCIDSLSFLSYSDIDVSSPTSSH